MKIINNYLKITEVWIGSFLANKSPTHDVPYIIVYNKAQFEKK